MSIMLGLSCSTTCQLLWSLLDKGFSLWHDLMIQDYQKVGAHAYHGLNSSVVVLLLVSLFLLLCCPRKRHHCCCCCCSNCFPLPLPSLLLSAGAMWCKQAACSSSKQAVCSCCCCHGPSDNAPVVIICAIMNCYLIVTWPHLWCKQAVCWWWCCFVQPTTTCPS